MVYRAAHGRPGKSRAHGTVAWNYQNTAAPAAVGNEIGGLGLGVAPPVAAASLETIE
jgi:hypothetical protein